MKDWIISAAAGPHRRSASRFPIALGTHRGKGRNEEWTANRLWKRLQSPLIDTEITWARYLNLGPSKEDQSLKSWLKAKPGWFKMGHYKDGRRRKDHLLRVSAISLDLDSVSQEQIDYIRSGGAPINEFVWMGHTTRSHMPEKPRWRLIILLDRAVNLDEANALARLLSTLLADEPQEGVEMVDQVSFRNNQAMYWPSICEGQPFETYRSVDGKLLDVDEFLSHYPNWHDVTALPKQAHERSAAAGDPNKRFEDPREKPGLIGAFCRAFDIEAAIAEFIPDIYTPGESTGSDIRYTYALGSQFNGAVVYDDGQIIYSNHGTDPIQGGANAFDMVRIHKYGHLDAKSDEDASPTSLPSYKAMIEFVQDIPEVAVELRSHMADAFDADGEDDFGPGDEGEDDEDVDAFLGLGDDDGSDSRFDADPEDEVDDFLGLSDEPRPAKRKDKAKRTEKAGLAWMAHFRTKANGDIEPVVHNIALICKNDPRIAPAIGYNEFTLDPVAFKPIRMKNNSLPSPPVPHARGKNYRRWQDGDDIAIRLLASAPSSLGGYEVEFPRNTVMEGVLAAGYQNKFHPVRDEMERCHRLYVESGRKSKGAIETLPQRYLGCEDDEFHRQSSRFFMLGLVARIFEPGCKFDCVVIIRGDQGGRKGDFYKTLAKGHFSNLPNNFHDVGRMVEGMKGALICELGEMAGLRKETSEIAKDFITKQDDQIRLAYGKRECVYPRQSVLVGTSNLTEILHDPTGNRRFWIWVDTHREDEPIDIEALAAEVDMLWGEAVDEYLLIRQEQPHGNLWLDLRTREARRQRDKIADAYRAASALEVIAEAISDWLDTPIPALDCMRDEKGFTLEGYEKDETPMIRNMVTPQEAFEALHGTPVVSAYRNADVRTYGKAMALLPRWRSLGKVRRHDMGQKQWFCRGEDGPRWVPEASV